MDDDWGYPNDSGKKTRGEHEGHQFFFRQDHAAKESFHEGRGQAAARSAEDLDPAIRDDGSSPKTISNYKYL